MSKQPATALPVCRQMCKQCPFHKESAQGWIGGWGTPEELLSYVNFEQPFTCHKTMNTQHERLCAGALLLMRKTCKRPRDLNLQKAMDSLADLPLDNVLGFNFIKYHTLKKSS